MSISSRLGLAALAGGGLVAGYVFGRRGVDTAAAAAPSSAAAAQSAICILHSDNGSGVTGTVTLTRHVSESGLAGVRVRAEVRGLADGPHGFHVHHLGDLSKGCASTQGHFNPDGFTHGGPDDDVRHAGDLGNIVSRGGVAAYDRVDTRIALEGPRSVVGRAFVIHAGEDDLGRGGHDDSLTTGHAGARLACGVIGIAAEASQ